MFSLSSAFLPSVKRYTANFTNCLWKYYSNQVRNHYSVLGVKPQSTDGEIKEAYYSLSKLYHPDKNIGNEAAAEKILEINAAFEVLGNKSLREEYNKKIFPALQFDIKKTSRKIYNHPEYYNPSIYQKKIIHKPRNINCSYEQYKKHCKSEIKRKHRHLTMKCNFLKDSGAKNVAKMFSK